MFKKSTTNSQIDFFRNFSMNLDEKRAETLSDPKAWHNQFFEHVTNRIDESHFDVLYHDHMGRSNAPVRILLSMMSIKAGFGWSDAQLFEQAHFNLTVMKALGFENLSDKVPAPSTYYSFKQMVYRYNVEHGRDLIYETFKTLTKTQADIFDVNGDKVRMDSKLIGSNIVRCSRLQLIISCLQAFWESLSAESKSKLGDNDSKLLNELCKKKPNQIVYPMSEDEKSQKLVELGELLLHLQQHYDDSDSTKYFLVERILSEQYEIKENKTELKPGKEISADSIQSPHDTDAAHRKKSNKVVNGFSFNATETCNDTGLNLVIDIQAEKATHADNDYVQSALDNVKDVIGPIGDAHMDGAYQSPENAKYGDINKINMIFTGIQGTKGNFELIKTDNGLRVFNRKTGETNNATQYKANHYKIKLPSGKWRYFKPAEIESNERRKAIENLPVEVKNRRNNVEATIFQLCFHTRNNKTRYRGLFQNKIWAVSRTIWTNLIRIKKHVSKSDNQPEVALI